MNSTVSTEVRDYVAQVRAALADLPTEDVEEFTTGMEADLTERLAEPGDGTLRDRLGEPDAYAAELRSAAGLPPRAALVQSKKPVAQRVSGLWSDLSGSALTAMPWLRDLRPVWWALRGVALATIPALILGVAITWLGLFGAIVSIVAGLLARNGKLTGGWVGPVRVIGNVTAGLLLPFAFVLFVDGPSDDETSYSDPYAGSGEGISYLGEPVANVYAYDETGRRLDKVRLYDQNGRALGISPESVMYGPLDSTGAIDPQTGQVTAELDVFPLRWPGHDAWLKYNEWEPPVAITPLPGPVPTVDASPSPTVTMTTSPTPSPSASVSRSPASPQTSPSSGVSATPTPTPTASPSASR
ncbi:HAAS signaling domain-containing protein [Knoellia sp. CPCC 206453]|uniref:HAAS signaling domain-containing protein n=1 Tax=Knoellia pratensis TaxID=3404796 RepID=UPI00361DF2CF